MEQTVSGNLQSSIRLTGRDELAELARLLDRTIGADWRLDVRQIAALTRHADSGALRAAFAIVKHANKARLATHIERELGIRLDPSSLFDVQVKRIHEYKRQLLNLLHVVTRYQAILADPHADWLPRSVVIAGKAASSYHMAKQIIRLVHDVAAVINADARIANRLKLAFVPNYGVSVAELVMPAGDLSQQISNAGTEASGTGNMKSIVPGCSFRCKMKSSPTKNISDGSSETMPW